MTVGQPSLEDQIKQVRRAYDRMQNATAVIIGVAREQQGAGADAIDMCIRAVRESVVRLASAITQMEGDAYEDAMAADGEDDLA